MKRLAAAVLGLALSFSLAPAAQAQSLNFGSLSGPETTNPEPVPNGYPYEVVEWGHYTALDNWHLCEVGIDLNLMVETNGPGAGHGYVGATDKQTGRTVVNDLDTRYSSDVYVFNYADSTQTDWLGTTREFTIFVEDFTTRERRTLGTMHATIPDRCSVGEGTAVLANGHLMP